MVVSIPGEQKKKKWHLKKKLLLNEHSTLNALKCLKTIASGERKKSHECRRQWLLGLAERCKRN